MGTTVRTELCFRTNTTMGCCFSLCESTPDVPENIIPDPVGPCHFVVESCSMFNKDYEVYKDEKGKDNRWLFLNRECKAWSDKSRIDLENYVREDDEKPDFKQAYDSDSSSDGFSSDGFKPKRRYFKMRWKMETKATIKSVKFEGLKYKIKVKAKGVATRIVHKSIVKNEETGEEREVTSYTDNEDVKKISYKVKDAETGDTVDKFKIKGLTKNELKWKCGAFKATKEGGFFFPGPTEVTTEGPVDPGFCLIMAHICATEFAPDEIKRDFKPKWWDCPGYTED